MKFHKIEHRVMVIAVIVDRLTKSVSFLIIGRVHRQRWFSIAVSEVFVDSDFEDEV